MSLARSGLSRRSTSIHPSVPVLTEWTCFLCQQARSSGHFSTSTQARQKQRQDGRPSETKLRTALRNTKIQWKPIPVGLGIAFLGAVQFYRVRAREKERLQQEHDDFDAEEAHQESGESKGKPKRRKRIRPSGPW